MPGPGARLPEPGAHACDQLGERERLGEVVGRPELQASHLRLHIRKRRQDEDPLVGAVLHQILQNGHPVEMREQQIEDDELVTAGLGQLEGSVPIVRAVHLEPFGGERPRDEADDPRLIVDHQHPGHGRMLRPGRPVR